MILICRLDVHARLSLLMGVGTDNKYPCPYIQLVNKYPSQRFLTNHFANHQGMSPFGIFLELYSKLTKTGLIYSSPRQRGTALNSNRNAKNKR